MKITGNESEQVIMKELGFRIKQYRISLNITQNGLADKCGISASTVVRIESGDKTLRSRKIYQAGQEGYFRMAWFCGRSRSIFEKYGKNRKVLQFRTEIKYVLHK